MSIDQVFTSLQSAQSLWGELYDLLRRYQYDTSAPRAAINEASVDIMHRNALLVFDTLNAIRPDSESDNGWAVIGLRSAELRSHFSTFTSHMQAAINQIHSYQRENLTIRDGNNNFSWQFYDGQVNPVNADVSTNFSNANAALLGLLSIVSSLLPLCKAKAVGDLSERAQALASTVSEIEGYRSEAQKLAKSTSTANEKANGFAATIQESLATAQTIQASIQAVQQQVDKDSAAITTLIAQIKSTGSSADTLEQQIAGYKSKFEAFQTQLDERLKQFATFEANIPKAEKQNVAREAEIDRLTQKADSMIKGATTAGLSNSLEETRSIYADRMYFAGGGFIVSIVILTISAIPLAAHLLPGLFGDWIKIASISPDARDSAATIIGKIVLLLPGSWLSLFFSKTFSEFFHLEREYAHKAALAKSVEGFKREAPDFEQEITTGVFGEILNSPSSRKSPEPASHPIYEVLTKRLEEWLVKKS
jgi:uncharacterized protein YoxC